MDFSQVLYFLVFFFYFAPESLDEKGNCICAVWAQKQQTTTLRNILMMM